MQSHNDRSRRAIDEASRLINTSKLRIDRSLRLVREQSNLLSPSSLSDLDERRRSPSHSDELQRVG
jgi:hypothetical protein